MPDGDTGAPTTTTATTTTTEAPWFQGADPETVGYFQNRGLDKKTAAEAAIAAAKAHREAEKFVGAPADQLLRVPKDAADAAGWDAVWSKLGVPKDAKAYDFSSVKRADGQAADPAFQEKMREWALSNKLTPNAALSLAQEFVKFQDGTAAGQSAELTAKLALEKDTLAKNWGTNFEANKFVASQAAKALGIDPETVVALEKTVGYAKVMEMFRTIGTKIGEDKFVLGGQQAGNGIMSRDQAMARKSELKNDKAFVSRFLAGDREAVAQMGALDRLIVGV